MAHAVRITHVTPVYPRGFLVQWTVDAPSQDATFTFDLARSGSTEGPWEPVASGLAGQYAFLDALDQPTGTLYRDVRRPQQFSFSTTFYYRLQSRASTGETAEVVEDTDPQLDPKMAQAWRRGTRDLQVRLRLNSLPVVVLKRRRWGVRCARCTDKVLREPTRAACTTCYGTKFHGGYWAPVLTRMQRLSSDDGSQVTPEAREDRSVANFLSSYAPVLDPQDLIVSVRDNRRYEVDEKHEALIQASPIRQIARVVELARDHVAYRIPIDATSLNPIL